MSTPRIAVVGVVRRRQGTGEYLARAAHAAGAQVTAFVGTRPESLAEGRAALAEHGIDAEGFTDADALVATHAPDALFIASPPATHAEYLQVALRHGLHVLTEKPAVWGTGDDAGRVEELVEAFGERDRLLWECVQWPLTLAAYRALHPQVLDAPLRHFGMRLSPIEGRTDEMLRDSLSHPLSLLQALAPPTSDDLPGLSFSTHDANARRIEISFRYPGGDRGIVVRIVLEVCARQPRPASYSVNGAEAARQVSLPEYALHFEHAGRRVPVPDPTAGLVARFVAALGGEEPVDLPVSGPAVSWRARALAEIVAGFARVSGGI